jgi:hypothetical protein
MFESRIMTLRHIAAIHFEGHAEAAKKRVQKLKSAGFLRARLRTVSEPAIHLLTRKAFDALNQHGMLGDGVRIGWAALEKRTKVGDLKLRHELGVMDCKTALVTAVRAQPSLSLVEFSTWSQLIQFKATHPVSGTNVRVKPDGFIRMEDTCGRTKTHVFFLEVDYSTETLETLSMKLRCYRDHYRHGGFAKQLGHSVATYRSFPFRVLVVCKTTDRRDNLAELLRKSSPPVRTFACIVTLEEFLHAPLGCMCLV